MFGTKKSFVPIAGAQPDGEDLRVAVAKDQVKDAPRVDPDQELSEDEERALFEHYGVPYTTEGSTTAQGAPTAGNGQTSDRAAEGAAGNGRSNVVDGDRVVGHDTSGPNTDDAMTRSEEELSVGTQRESGRVRLRKYVVTEQVSRDRPGRAKKYGSSGNRSPTQTATRRCPAWTSPRRSTRSCCTRSGPSSRSRRSGGTGSPGHRHRHRAARMSEEVRKEQIEADGIDRP